MPKGRAVLSDAIGIDSTGRGGVRGISAAVSSLGWGRLHLFAVEIKEGGRFCRA